MSLAYRNALSFYSHQSAEICEIVVGQVIDLFSGVSRVRKICFQNIYVVFEILIDKFFLVNKCEK